MDAIKSNDAILSFMKKYIRMYFAEVEDRPNLF